MTTASVMTYDSLVENVQSYLERTDTATLEKIPLFIMLAPSMPPAPPMAASAMATPSEAPEALPSR